MGEALTIRVRRDRGYAIVAVAGEVDIATVSRLRESLFGLAASGRTLVVDLDQVSFIDSSGLAALVGAARRAAAHGASLQVVCARPQTRQLFRLTGLDSQLPLARTLDGALESLAAAGPRPPASGRTGGPARRPCTGGRDAAPAAAGDRSAMCSAARWSPRPWILRYPHSGSREPAEGSGPRSWAGSPTGRSWHA